MCNFVKNLSLALALAGAVTHECTAFTTPLGTRGLSKYQNVQAIRTVPTELAVFSGPRSKATQKVETEVDESSTIFDSVIDPLSDLSMLALRLATCSLMVHHGLDKIQNVDGFSANVVAKFFGFLPGPSSFWTYSAAATQVAGAGLLAVGVLARPVAFSMMVTMLVAVVFHLLNTGPEGFPLAVVAQHSYNYELAAMYVGVLAYFSVAGAGAYSIDEKLLGGELKLYESALNKITRDDN